MFLVLLRFGDNKAAAPDHMAGHQDWIQQGIRDGVFLLVGSLKPGLGGAVLAAGTDRDQLGQRVAGDPFVVHDVVTAEIVEIEPNFTDPRLSFLAG
ncbi:YciI family protein [Gordonia sp. (in: high G+C Gram-positive bacteria)]|uniref:YciI family protein n=1 Tax=unclassified Gordonia (in: high G+C Gram-positive bacteria) TaxID=2657482 RepID=UPI003529C0A2